MDRIRLNPDQFRQSQNAGPSTSKANPQIVSRGIQALFSAYRSSDFADGEGFVAQLGVVLAEFPDEVVAYVTSPRTGIQRRSKWPPTISEVLEACEQHQDYLRKLKDQRPVNRLRLAPPSAQTRAPGYLASIHVPEGHPRYARLVEWTKAADEKFWKFGPNSEGKPGLWITLDVWQGGTPAPVKQPEVPARDLSATPELRAAMAQRLDPDSELDRNANEGT